MAKRKFGNIIETEEDLKNAEAASTGDFKVLYIQDEVTITVRFLHEPDEGWCSFQQVYDNAAPKGKKSWPLPEDSSAPGGEDHHDLKPSRRYLANVVLVDDGKGNNPDRVYALLLPATLFDKLKARYEKTGSLTDRDFDLWRTGTKLDTKYDYDANDRVKRDLSKYELFDLQDILGEQYDAVWGDDAEDDDDEDEKPKARRPRRVVEDDVDEDEEPAPRTRPKAKAEPEEEDPEDDEEPAPKTRAPRKAKVEEEDDLDDLTLGELRVKANDAGHITRGLKKQDIIELLRG